MLGTRIIGLLVSLVFIKESASARILAVFASPSLSHQIVYRPLVQELAKRHDLVVITSYPAFQKGKAPANITEIDVHDLMYGFMDRLVSAVREKDKELYGQIKIIMDVTLESTIQLWHSNEVQNIVESENNKFDLIFTEVCMRQTLIFTHLFKAPTIQINSMGGNYGTFESVGAPTNPLLYPTALNQKFVNLTIWEKMTELYNLFNIMKVHVDADEKFNMVTKKEFGPDFPTIDELSDNIRMIFLNVHPLWDANRPVPPSVIYLGGLHEKPEQELPTTLKSYLDASTNGVIYMSLGSNVLPSWLPPEKIEIFLKVFSTLPHNVLWKWDTEELKGKPSNVQISKWFPQSDLLRHPNVKLFITQGGLQSTDEAITAGVPLVGIPILGDQWYNTELYVQHKIGMKLNMETLTEEVLKNSINTVINDGSYRSNVIKLRTLKLDQPQSPLERAVWWTEYVLRHGGAKHLQAPAANMPWTQYYELELVIIILSGLMLTVLMLIFLLKFVWTLLFPKLLNIKEKDN